MRGENKRELGTDTYREAGKVTNSNATTNIVNAALCIPKGLRVAVPSPALRRFSVGGKTDETCPHPKAGKPEGEGKEEGEIYEYPIYEHDRW